MKKVLLLNPTYFPGYKAGGPQQTVKNICDIYGNKSEIYLITKNRDFGSEEPYDLPVNIWIKNNNIKVKYVEPKDYGYRVFVDGYNRFDTIYSCGMFSKNSYMMMVIHKLLHNRNKTLYVAPMGVFSSGAISIKSRKKKLFLKAFSILGFFDNVVWSLTSTKELEEARQLIPNHLSRYIIAEDLPKKVDFEISKRNITEKERGKLKIVFLSRISQKKNLEACVDILNGISDGEITFDIYGMKEDEDYWSRCVKKIESLPSNIDVNYRGEVRPEEVISIFSKYDVFLFPTKGENFGHVIFESLASGCLPIVSDRTPWQDLKEQECGEICDLENLDEFRESLRNYLHMDKRAFRKMKENALKYACKKYNFSVNNSGYNTVFID